MIERNECGVSLPAKHIIQVHLQSIHDLLKAPQGDALFTILKPKQCTPWQPSLLGKLSERHVPTLFLEELGELFIQG